MMRERFEAKFTPELTASGREDFTPSPRKPQFGGWRIWPNPLRPLTRIWAVSPSAVGPLCWRWLTALGPPMKGEQE